VARTVAELPPGARIRDYYIPRKPAPDVKSGVSANGMGISTNISKTTG